VQISNINVHAGFPTLLSNEEFASIAQQSKGNGDVFRQQLREALHEKLNTPPMRELRFTLCYYALPYAYTRPGTNGINTSNLVQGNKTMGRPNNKPQNRTDKAAPQLTLAGVKEAILSHTPLADESELEKAAYAVLTRVTKRHMSLTDALDDVLVPKQPEFVEVQLDLDQFDDDTREKIAQQIIALRKEQPQLSNDDALQLILTSIIETTVHTPNEVVTMSEQTNTNSNTLNLTPVSEAVQQGVRSTEPTSNQQAIIDMIVRDGSEAHLPEASVEESLEELRAKEEAYVADHGAELQANLVTGNSPNWKLVGGIAAGLALLGVAGYVGYRYYQRQQDGVPNLTVNDAEEI